MQSRFIHQPSGNHTPCISFQQEFALFHPDSHGVLLIPDTSVFSLTSQQYLLHISQLSFHAVQTDLSEVQLTQRQCRRPKSNHITTLFTTIQWFPLSLRGRSRMLPATWKGPCVLSQQLCPHRKSPTMLGLPVNPPNTNTNPKLIDWTDTGSITMKQVQVFSLPTASLDFTVTHFPYFASKSPPQ